MTRSPFVLAALASTAVPGLDPVSVEPVEGGPGARFDVAFLRDNQDRQWVVRAPASAAAAAQMDLSSALLGLLSRRLPFAVPAPKGFAAMKEGGRAAVYPFLPGRPLVFTGLPAGPGLAAELGRALAALHNLDRGIYEQSGVPVYDADGYRTRRLADLDRAAATGHVPTALLARWERALEDVSMWRFATTPTHGGVEGKHVLGLFESDDASSGQIRALTSWEQAKVADPADDFAALAAEATTAAFDSVLEAYAHARVERPDKHMAQRARVVGGLRLLPGLLMAVGSGDPRLLERHTAGLRALEEAGYGEDGWEDVEPTPPKPLRDIGKGATVYIPETRGADDSRGDETGADATDVSSEQAAIDEARNDDTAVETGPAMTEWDRSRRGQPESGAGPATAPTEVLHLDEHAPPPPPGANESSES